MEQLSPAELLQKQGYTPELISDLFRRHMRRVHTKRTDGRSFSQGRPCPICNSYATDYTALNYLEKIDIISRLK